ncbi:hypothetical protein P7C73_g3881, partial [Tremellales sp. Uapishka_1]
MSSLADSLSQLAQHSQQIKYLSSLNQKPSGPFVNAVLYTDVLSLVRGAEPSEERLFKFIGEVEGGREKKVEKREGVVTPLKELKKGRESKDDVDVMLKTAMKLVDDYRPMPRARAHIGSLLDAHQDQMDRIEELELLIAEATN